MPEAPTSLGELEVHLMSRAGDTANVAGPGGSAAASSPIRGKLRRLAMTVDVDATTARVYTVKTPAGTFVDTITFPSGAVLDRFFDIDKHDPANFLHEGESVWIESDGAGAAAQDLRATFSIVPA